MNNSIKLPDFLSHLEVVGTLKDSLVRCSAPKDLKIEDPEIVVTNQDSPFAAMPPALVEAYQKNDKDYIKKMQDISYNNLETIRKNIENCGDDAWVEVKDKEGVHFFVSYNDRAFTWVYPEQTITDGEKKQLVFNLGSLDHVTSQASFASLVLSNPVVQAIEGALLAVVVKVVTSMFAAGLSMAVDAIAFAFASAAAALGLGAFSFVIPAVAVTAVATVLTVGLAIGLVLLIDWIVGLVTPDFYIKLQIFNFDDNRDWKSDGAFLDNAKIAGKELSYEDFSIPRRKKAELPPFISGETDDIIVSYAEIDLENDSKFMEGLGVALSMKTDDASFTIASDCPYIGATVIKETTPEVSDLKDYFKDDSWCDGLKTNIDVNGMPVGMTLNTQHGADNNIYEVTVLIGKEAL
ncbi:MAG: hypothetical protein IK109_04440 [Clostridiales bacterium]|nr:hypothetical protein [Clostridiales bacterium]